MVRLRTSILGSWRSPIDIYIYICNYLVGGVHTIVHTTYILPLMFPPKIFPFFTSSCWGAGVDRHRSHWTTATHTAQPGQALFWGNRNAVVGWVKVIFGVQKQGWCWVYSLFILTLCCVYICLMMGFWWFQALFARKIYIGGVEMQHSS